MQKILQTRSSFLVITIACVLFYIALPNFRFPPQVPDAVQSLEPADTESSFRRAYFTNFNREEVMQYYQQQMRHPIAIIPLPAYRLNYPPEDAYTLIRDQTRSTFLEEIVNPFRESLFVNGFKPYQAKDEIWYKGKQYGQKITVKYIPSSWVVRILLFSTTIVLLKITLGNLFVTLKELLNWNKE